MHICKLKFWKLGSENEVVLVFCIHSSIQLGEITFPAHELPNSSLWTCTDFIYLKIRQNLTLEGLGKKQFCLQILLNSV